MTRRVEFIFKLMRKINKKMEKFPIIYHLDSLENFLHLYVSLHVNIR